MELFKRKQKTVPLSLLSDEMQPINFDAVLEYLVGLSGDDYTKICQVAAIYRQADHEAAKSLGRSTEPTTFIEQPAPVEAEPDFLDMLEDDPKPKGGKKHGKA